MSDTAEGYIRIATMAIRFAKSREELLSWWAEEQSNRQANGVTGSYERRLIEACRHHLEVISQMDKPIEALPVRKKRR